MRWASPSTPLSWRMMSWMDLTRVRTDMSEALDFGEHCRLNVGDTQRLPVGAEQALCFRAFQYRFAVSKKLFITLSCFLVSEIRSYDLIQNHCMCRCQKPQLLGGE